MPPNVSFVSFKILDAVIYFAKIIEAKINKCRSSYFFLDTLVYQQMFIFENFGMYVVLLNYHTVGAFYISDFYLIK